MGQSGGCLSNMLPVAISQLISVQMRIAISSAFPACPPARHPSNGCRNRDHWMT